MPVPCKQRLYFRCVSWRAKSSLCWQPFKSVQKSGRINEENGFFPVLDRFRALRESCVANQSCHNFFIPAKLAPFDDDYFACESRDEFRACTIENWTVVCRGYFSHDMQLTQRKCSLCSKGNVSVVETFKCIKSRGQLLTYKRYHGSGERKWHKLRV